MNRTQGLLPPRHRWLETIDKRKEGRRAGRSLLAAVALVERKQQERGDFFTRAVEVTRQIREERG